MVGRYRLARCRRLETLGVSQPERHPPNAPAAIGGADGARRCRLKGVSLRIEVDRESCMASGNCSMWAPGVFDHDDAGIAAVVDPAGEDDDTVLLAARNCPKAAIAVFRQEERLV